MQKEDRNQILGKNDNATGLHKSTSNLWKSHIIYNMDNKEFLGVTKMAESS